MQFFTRFFYIALIILVSIVYYPSITYAEYLFSRNLSQGMSGIDVLNLQKVLNSDAETIIASMGPGSPGQETYFFGGLTKNAVIRFQNKHYNEVLAPNNLTNGTGYVGPSTRAVLNSFSSIKEEVVERSTATSEISSPDMIKSENNLLLAQILQGVIPQSQAFNPLREGDLMIFGLSHTKVRVGDEVLIRGNGFTSNTMINIGRTWSTRSNATSSSEVTFKIPSILSGKYPIWLSDGVSSTPQNGVFYLIIGNEKDDRPSIISVNPVNASIEDIIEITGDRFDRSGNILFTNLGVIRNLSSIDGRTIKFKISDLPNSEKIFNESTVGSFTMTFSVHTSEGQTLNYGYVRILK